MNLQALLTNDTPSLKAYPNPTAFSTPYNASIGGLATPKHSPSSDPKEVTFKLYNSAYPSPTTQHRETPSLNVTIHPHDTTESIAFTVKSFFGLLPSEGSPNLRVSFEDSHGHYLILSHENLTSGMAVYVRAITDDNRPPAYSSSHSDVRSQYQSEYVYDSYHPSREPQYYEKRGRSQSPVDEREQRSTSVNSVSTTRTKGSKRYNSGTPGLDSNGDPKTKVEPLASAEISLDNILEGSRRKRLKFESSELPLFPETTTRFTASSTSASPTRATPQLTPYAQTPYNQQNRLQFPPQSSYLYSLGSDQSPPNNSFSTSRISLPTPAPTVASCISDEDVAIQLMRLGEVPICNGSPPNNRTYVEYSADEGSPRYQHQQSELNRSYIPSYNDINPRKRKEAPTTHYDTTEPSDDGEDDDVLDTTYNGNHDDADYQEDDEDDDKPLIAKRPALAPNRRAPAPPTVNGQKRKSGSSQSSTKPKNNNGARKLSQGSKPKIQMAPNGSTQFKLAPATMMPPALHNSSVPNNGIYSLVPPVMNQSNVATFQAISETQQPLTMVDSAEQAKPRCQRCRKSKKGCDRQRPCQRCKDAGIPAEQCISEDEAGTRRGRANAAKAANGGVKNRSAPKPKKKKVVVE